MIVRSGELTKWLEAGDKVYVLLPDQQWHQIRYAYTDMSLHDDMGIFDAFDVEDEQGLATTIYTESRSILAVKRLLAEP